MPQAAQTDRAAPGDRPFSGREADRLRSRENSILMNFLWRFPCFSTIIKMTVETQSSGYALSFDKDCHLMEIVI